ncbi:MAG: 3'-5' exonuclease [Pseudomonadales bacterium]|nr:3'-5' exonuclease [Pseudomonadales bacterium]
MKAIFWDTETTGLPLFKEPSSDPRQPHIVQLAAALVDLDEKHVISSIDVITKPDGWEIPEEVSKIHGITTEMAMECGIPEHQALELFLSLFTDASGELKKSIAHNEQFDARIIRIALKRFGHDEESIDAFEDRDKYCTMRESTKIVQCPPTAKMKAAGRNHFKNPNLSEAYKHFTGKELSGAHNAMVDVKACMNVYFGIQKHEATN